MTFCMPDVISVIKSLRIWIRNMACMGANRKVWVVKYTLDW